MLATGIVLVLAGLLVIISGELTATGRLGINAVVGLRFGAVMATDEGWTAGHRAARVPMDLAGATFAGAGLLLLLAPLPEDATGTVVLVASALALGMIVIAAVVAQRAATKVLYRIAAED